MENGEWRSSCEHDKWINDTIVIPFLSRMLYGDGVERTV